jgi:hypothetical protein
VSAEALTLPRVRAAEDARPVYFKVTRRVDVRLLSWWQRRLYVFLCRRLPEAWRVPPVPPMERGGFDSFALADAYCTSKDDQIRVLPWGWASAGDSLDSDVVCRPRDPSDAKRYLALREQYADEEEYGEIGRLADWEATIGRLTERVRAAL